MSAINLVPAALGRFMTRSSRLVEITGSEQVKAPRPGGGTITKTVFIGTLFKMDGKTVDSKHRWEESGQFENQRGVSSQFDLCQRIGGPPETAPVPAVLEESNVGGDLVVKDLDVHIVLAPYVQDGETTIDALKRLLGELDELRIQKAPAAKAKTKTPAKRKAARK